VRRLAVLILCACVLPVSAAHAWTWPVDGPVLKAFSFDRARPYAGGQHRGVDLGAPPGTSVLAPAEGVVSFAGTVPSGGKTVSIETPRGYTATLLQLGSIGVKPGALVDEGSVVGTVGPSGDPEQAEPHVHFGVRVTAEQQGYVDPLSLLPAQRASVSPSTATALPVTAAPAVETAVEAPVVARAAGRSAENVPAAVPTAQSAAPARAQPAVAADPLAVTPQADAAGRQTAPAAAQIDTVASRAQLPPRAVRAVVAPEADSVAVPNLDEPELHIDRQPESVRMHARDVGRFNATGGSSLTPDRSSERDRSTSAVRASGVVKTSVPDRAREKSGGDGQLRFALALAALTIAARLGFMFRRAVLQNLARIMSLPEREPVVGEAESEEDPGRTGVAVRVRETSPGPRGGLRRAGGHLRAVPPFEGQRRSDGERHGRARNARDGDCRPRGRLAA
jgi:hypothetical protein